MARPVAKDNDSEMESGLWNLRAVCIFELDDECRITKTLTNKEMCYFQVLFYSYFSGTETFKARKARFRFLHMMRRDVLGWLIG